MDVFSEATAGYKEVPSGWMSATGLRSLIQSDPCLLWLKYHGAAHGLEEDAKEYSFLEWIGDKGRAFEAAWIKNVAPEAVQALDEDVDVRRVQGLMKTLELIQCRVPVITKAALWWAPERIYGSADSIVLASWLYRYFPHLKPADDDPDHYVVLDCKFTTGLDKSEKKIDLACNTAQVRMYSYMLGHLQGHMPQHAYLVCRDRTYNPLPVAVDHNLDGPLDPHLAHLRDLHLHIRHHGAQYVPWRDQIVAPNFSNSHDDPWHGAKKKIMRELVPGGALEMLPHVGPKQAEALKGWGYESVGHLLMHDTSRIPFEKLNGIGKKTGPRLRAVLEANRTGTASVVNAALLPPRHDVEMFVDFEYFTNVNADFDGDWPALEGREMIFTVGAGWEEDGEWKWKKFVAAREDGDAERAMFEEFLSFLEARGVFGAGKSAALYHWSNAEMWQSKRAAERLGLERLAALPWYDLQKPWHQGPIAIPEAWDYGLKSVAKALGSHSPEHQVEWPEELGAGLAAMVMGWRAYEQPKPLETTEMAIISRYLEVDCKAMWAVLSWMRAVAVKLEEAEMPMAGGWYSRPQRGERRKKGPSKQNKPSKSRKGRRRGGVEEGCGWYRLAALALE